MNTNNVQDENHHLLKYDSLTDGKLTILVASCCQSREPDHLFGYPTTLSVYRWGKYGSS
jgi:hypothetical protein